MSEETQGDGAREDYRRQYLQSWEFPAEDTTKRSAQDTPLWLDYFSTESVMSHCLAKSMELWNGDASNQADLPSFLSR